EDTYSMTKVMLVEDDNNLRDIYEARLLAEGYDIVTAKDGEEALALAVKEKPDLIISDVMMPKISGFDMLDILRSTPETKNTKVIMMTALSQAEDKSRANKLGADRYLVKSQVTLEDVAKTARDVLEGNDSQSPAAPADTTAAPSAPQADAATPATTAAAQPAATDSPAPQPAAAQPAPAEAPAPALAQPPADQPVASSTPPPASPAPVSAPAQPPADISQTTAEEAATIDKQIQDFIASNPTLSTSADTPAQPAQPASGNPPPATASGADSNIVAQAV